MENTEDPHIKLIEKSTKKFEIVNQWISNCDTKVSFLLAFQGVLLSFLISSTIFVDIISTLTMRVEVKPLMFGNLINFVSLLVLLAFIFYTSTSFYYIYHTLRASLDPSVYRQEGVVENSNFFFLSIAAKQYRDFNNEIRNESNEAYLNDLNSQLFINSCICDKKFKNYNKSIKSVFIGTALLIVYILSVHVV